MSEDFKTGDKVYFEDRDQAEVVGPPKLYVPIRIVNTKRRDAMLVSVDDLSHREPPPNMTKVRVDIETLCNSCESRVATKRITALGPKCSQNTDSSVEPGYLVCDECDTPNTCDCTVAVLSWVAPVIDGLPGEIDVFSDHSHRFVPTSSYLTIHERLRRAEEFIVDHADDELLTKFAAANDFVVERTKMGRRTIVARKP